MIKQYLAEVLGTFTLTLVVVLSLSNTFPIATPVLAGLTLGLFVYTIGHISGAHINPAVTVGIWAIGKIKTLEALLYIVSQFVGAGLAMVVAEKLNKSVALQTEPVTLAIGLAEFVGTMLFTFGIASVVYKKVHDSASGIVIGVSLMLGIGLAALMGSAGFLNPAVAFGANSFNSAYILGPLCGSIAGMWLYKYLKTE